MQYCSLQNRTLLPSPVTSTTGCCFHFGSASSFLLELFLHWSPVAYWACTNLGSSSLRVKSFCLFILFMGLSGQECGSGLPLPSPVTTFPQNSPATFYFYQHLLLECWLSSGQLDLSSVTGGQLQLCINSRVNLELTLLPTAEEPVMWPFSLEGCQIRLQVPASIQHRPVIHQMMGKCTLHLPSRMLIGTHISSLGNTMVS